MALSNKASTLLAIENQIKEKVPKFNGSIRHYTNFTKGLQRAVGIIVTINDYRIAPMGDYHEEKQAMIDSTCFKPKVLYAMIVQNLENRFVGQAQEWYKRNIDVIAAEEYNEDDNVVTHSALIKLQEEMKKKIY